MRVRERLADGGLPDSRVTEYEGFLSTEHYKTEDEAISATRDVVQAFLDAAAVLWRVGATEGAHLYGDHYAPISTFVATHARLAGDACCDHMHDGCGFVTQHSALSLSFEASLQAVDASVALPYWDYSIDVERVARDYGGDAFGRVPSGAT